MNGWIDFIDSRERFGAGGMKGATIRNALKTRKINAIVGPPHGLNELSATQVERGLQRSQRRPPARKAPIQVLMVYE